MVNIVYKKINNTKKNNYLNLSFLREPDVVIKKMKELYPNRNKNTYGSYLNAITSILKRVPEYRYEYLIYSKENIIESNKQRQNKLDNEDRMNEQQQKNYLEWNKILALENKVKQKGNLEDKIIYYLYTKMPPRRLEYSSLIIKDSEDELNDNENYIVVNDNDMKIILNNYKTSKKYGKYIIDNLSDVLKNSILDLIKSKNKGDGDYLFTNSKNKNYNQNQFSNRINRLFLKVNKKKVGLNILRHSFISNLYRSNPSNKKKIEIASFMSHDVRTQGFYNFIQ